MLNAKNRLADPLFSEIPQKNFLKSGIGIVRSAWLKGMPSLGATRSGFLDGGLPSNVTWLPCWPALSARRRSPCVEAGGSCGIRPDNKIHRYVYVQYAMLQPQFITITSDSGRFGRRTNTKKANAKDRQGNGPKTEEISSGNAQSE